MPAHDVGRSTKPCGKVSFRLFDESAQFGATMTVVVTGASGHIGANLVRELLRRQFRVRVVVHRRAESLEALDVERADGDVRDPQFLERAFEGAETVYHLAAIISIDGDKGGKVFDVNVRGASNVASACLRCGVRKLVHCSSIHAFDSSPRDQALDETCARVTNLAAAPAYDRSKALGETAVREIVDRGLDAVILHPSAVIGPHDYEPSRMGRLFLDLYHGRLPSLVDGGFNWVDVRDVVQSAISAAERGQRGESYLLTGHWANIEEVAELAAEITGTPPPRFVSPMFLARMGMPFVSGWARLRGREALYTSESLAALRSFRSVSCEKAASALGHSPRPLLESIRDTYQWFAENGRIPDHADATEELKTQS